MADHLQKPIKVLGHLYEKRDIYQIVLSWVDEEGKRQRKSQSTGLKVKGNKKRAEEIMKQAIKDTAKLLSEKPKKEDVLFADFMENWLESMRKEVKMTTFGGYQYNVQTAIVPYFRKRGTLLRELTAVDVNDFYDAMLENVKATTANTYAHLEFNSKLAAANAMTWIDKTPMGSQAIGI